MKILYSGQRGSALILTAVTLVLLATFAGTLTLITGSSYKYQSTSMSKLQTEYLANEAAERFRIDVYKNYKASTSSPGVWMQSLRDQNNSSTPTMYWSESASKVYNIPLYQGNATPDSKQRIARAWVSGVSDASSMEGWVEITGKAVLNNIATEVIVRVSFGQPNMFSLALLTKTVNCMCCHLVVKGDAGTLGDFRPGWGTENVNGHNSGSGSYIYGDLYSSGGRNSNDQLKYALAKTGDGGFNNYFFSKDNASNLQANNGDYSDAILADENLGYFKINGLRVEGEPKTSSEKIGSKLPEDKDGDGTYDFPILDPQYAKLNAKGGITSAEQIWTVPMDGNINLESPNASNITDGYYNGNIVLVGTEDNPIKLNGDLVVEGDVVIKGFVEGRGTIYAGRNVYIAGDIVYKNAPKNYSDLPEEERDQEAKNEVGNTDELRLGARNTVVIGDYVRKMNGSTLPISERQAYDFYYSQFEMNKTGYFKKAEDDERSVIELQKKEGKYYDDLGNEVPADQVVSKSYNSYYDYTFNPGSIDSNGSFHSWMTSEQYRTFMGKESLEYNSWRGGGFGSDTINKLKQNGFTQDEAETIKNGGSKVDLGDKFVKKDGSTIRVVIDGAKEYTTQVGRVDAFIYSNKRIAGKTSGKNLVVNGGLISEVIGILAPGYKREGWMSPEDSNRYHTFFNSKKNVINKSHYLTYYKGGGEYFKQKYTTDDGMGARHDKMTVHYDYRMRNGGQGYNLLKGQNGKRIYWRKKHSTQ